MMGLFVDHIVESLKSICRPSSIINEGVAC
jgi:hypothetical protein